MQNFQDTFKTCEQSFNIAFSICMNVPLTQKAISFNGVTIVSFTGNDYRIHFSYMSIDEGINIKKTYDLRAKNKIIIHFFFLIYKR